MIFVFDESVDRQIADRLRDDGHEVHCVWEMAPSIPDEAVLDRANANDALLVTADKDFGELVFRQHRVTAGVVLIRLAGLSQATKATIVAAAVREHGPALRGSFAVVAPGLVRVRHDV